MLTGGGTIFFEGDNKQYEAAGHCAAYHINGEDIFICHGYSITHKGASILVRKSIRWSADGWPYLIL
jgi:arabinan endo-1,5-alpha-L-arabinosidase